MSGSIVSVNLSEKKGTKKVSTIEARLLVNHGFLGDAHAGEWHRQVSLLAEESIDKIQGKGIELHPGDFAENITTRGLDLTQVKIGTRFRLGDAEIEITQIGKKCHHGCEIRRIVGDCVMPREGIFAKVIHEGNVRVGDVIQQL